MIQLLHQDENIHQVIQNGKEFLDQKTLESMNIEDINCYIDFLLVLHGHIVENDPRYHMPSGLSIWYEGFLDQDVEVSRYIWEQHFQMATNYRKLKEAAL
jgi:hypothetical protein